MSVLNRVVGAILPSTKDQSASGGPKAEGAPLKDRPPPHSGQAGSRGNATRPKEDIRSVEVQLQEALSKKAREWIEILNANSKDPATGKFIIDVRDQMKMFEMASSWLVKSAKLRPPEDGGIPQGIEDLRKLIYGVVDVALEEKGVGKPKPGRQSKAVLAVRARKQAEAKAADPTSDDSKLRKLLNQPAEGVQP